MHSTNIPIRNIYYMLSYAFRCLQHEDFEQLGAEAFSDANNLLAAILAKGVAQLLKQGLYREYSESHESTSVIRGRLDLLETTLYKIQNKRDVVCETDILSEDNQFNRILKTTMILLFRDNKVKKQQKADLKSNLLYFTDITEINPLQISWSTIRYQRNNQRYRMLLTICRLVINNLIQDPTGDDYLLETFSDKVIHEVFEHFVYEYYNQDGRNICQGLIVEHGAWINWDFPESQNADCRILPVMISDIMLHYKGKTLIIDTKYYNKIFVRRKYSEKESIRSAHIYQIFTYIKNYDKEGTGNVSGLLLYAKTEDENLNRDWVTLAGSRIGIDALDLNQNFECIKRQLDGILWKFIRDM